MDILKKIRRERERTLSIAMSERPESELLESIRSTKARGGGGRFHDALSPPGGPQLIAELKKASPSAGLIRADFDVERIARQYREAGAAALSVLTEPSFFQGSLEYLRTARAAVDLPILRKDFMFHRYQLLEAVESRADAILLIVAMLSAEELRYLHEEALKLGLDALVEVHSAEEMGAALDINPRLVGINNRNLKTMCVDIETTFHLRKMIPDGVLAVSESGIKGPDDVRRLRDAGINAMLVGESLMRCDDPGAAARKLVEA